MSLASESAACPVCNEPMQRVFRPLPVMNRQKPGTMKSFLNRKWAEDGRVGVLAAYKAAEEKGATFYREWMKDNDASEAVEMKQFKRVNCG